MYQLNDGSCGFSAFSSFCLSPFLRFFVPIATGAWGWRGFLLPSLLKPMTIPITTAAKKKSENRSGLIRNVSRFESRLLTLIV